MSIPRILALVCACALCACKSERPTEFINVAFKLSEQEREGDSWKFDQAGCVDFDVGWIDHDGIRSEMVNALESALTEGGHERVLEGEADLLVSYEFWVEPGTTRETPLANARGSIVVRDGRTGEFLWRGTKKTRLASKPDGYDSTRATSEFVEALLQYTSKIE